MPRALSSAPDKASSTIHGIVPPEFLDPPMRHERRWLLRDECALVIDRFLRRLTRQEALCRRVLGRLAATFLDRRGHHRLGFARLRDYARERLGTSAREMQSLAQVSASLDRLPQIAAAFESGEVTWAQVRLLAVTVDPATEDHWLSLARGRTVRALEALREAATHGVEAESASDEDDSIDSEPRLRFRMSCPRRVSSSWRRALELAERMAGEALPAWRAAEAIAAEALSAMDGTSALIDPPTVASREIGDRSTEPAGVEVSSEAETRDAFGDLDWSAIDETIPEPVEDLSRSLEAVDAFGLDDRMRRVHRSMHHVDRQLGRLLRLFIDMRLHRLMGFDSASRYVRERLGMSPSKGRALIHLERQTAKVPELASAYRDGEISWVRTLALLPVAGEPHARAWVERAKSVTVRRLIDEVEWAIDARDARALGRSVAPPPSGTDLVQAERQMCAHGDTPVVDGEITFCGPASVVGLLRMAVAAFAQPFEPAWRGLEKVLEHVHREWAAQPRHRDPVFARDGWRCAVPACSSRRNLHDHHILFRSRGGDNARDNRVAVCAWHHLHGLHSGAVRARGKAPDEITWEIGVRAGGAPLLRLRGERYAEA